MSFAAVQRYVAVLERAGLFTKERHGREQLVRTDRHAVGLILVAEFDASVERVWELWSTRGTWSAVGRSGTTTALRLATHR